MVRKDHQRFLDGGFFISDVLDGGLGEKGSSAIFRWWVFLSVHPHLPRPQRIAVLRVTIRPICSSSLEVFYKTSVFSLACL